MSLFRKNKNYILNHNCLEVMSRMEDRSVDLIYLDPPWNTGNKQFDYNVNINMDYEEFIYSVLQQSKRILKLDGNLILYSIPFLNVNFHNLLTPIFGSENFKAEFIIPKKRLNARNKMFTSNHETVIFYSNSKESKFFPFVERSKEEIKKLFPLKEKGKHFKLDSLVVPGENLKLNFEWNGFELPENKVWRYSEQRLNQLEKAGKIFFGKDMRLPRLKIFSDEFSLQMIDSVWNDIEAYNIKEKNYAQSEQLLDRIIKLSTKENDTVLDPFMGSGVSGTSSIKNNRRWIGIDTNKVAFENSKKKLCTDSTKEILSKELLHENIIWDDYDSYKLSESEVIKNRISKGENARLEFKEAYNYNDHNKGKDNNISNKIMKEIAAFLNSPYGGSIFLGVRDNGEIRGLNNDLRVIDEKANNPDKLELAITSKIKETFNGSSIDLISTSFIDLEQKYVCEIKISPSNNPVFVNKEFYVRNGTQADTFKPEELFELMKKRRKF
ncbi:DNA methyltransferase [Arenibacter palladensis]|uniref:DNA methyltransferase n=1 Tax=Arenibacter palladensis TaxID=237373 RepID=UPI0026E3A860|nr:DNA methyltransferase [Arenibacter palladensis]MDO6605208.1 DNA methyltransferase [Arenibacter palladensis]